MHELTPWLMFGLLGAYHGLNPGMGWLFAVALGLQNRKRSAVIRALGPIAIGHAASVAVVVLIVAAAGTLISTDVLRYAGGVALIGFGLYKLLAPFSHPRWVGMRVNGRDLVVWSFLMATAHGAGLMLVPVLLRTSNDDAQAAQANQGSQAIDTMATDASFSLPGSELLAVAIHTGAMFLVMGLVAVAVFQWLGVKILRRGWFNLDRIWAMMLLAAGGFTFVA